MLFLFALASFAERSLWLSVAELTACVVVYIIFRIAGKRRERELMRQIDKTMSEVSRVGKGSSLNFPMPTAIIKLDTREIIWANSGFSEMVGEKDSLFERNLFDVVSEFDLSWIGEGRNEYPSEVKIGEKTYRVLGSMFRNEAGTEANIFVTLYWLDVTEYSDSLAELTAAKQIVSLVIVDNYGEIMNGLNDSERSTIIAEVDRRIAKWAEASQGILIRYERDKFLFIFEERSYEKYVAERFSVLDTVREIESKNGIKVTLSIGVGKDGHTFDENHKNAQIAIDMALSRGGDQAVIRNRFNFEFFGGKSQEVAKRTKVKSRVMANALAELIKDSSRVFVMGHKSADNDSIGAAVGILCMARKIGTEASIVVDNRRAADGLVEKLRSFKEYEDAFIGAEDAIIAADGDTLVVIVDTNRPSVVESEALLESANKIAIIDHHRRGADYIADAVLNFHEPYASSTCELVTELLQYIVETRDILSVEAEAILSGIIIDTKNFTMKTGVRTFEAAAYLRRAGADTTELKKVLQNDFGHYMKRAEIVKLARMYRDNIAIAEYNGQSTRLVAAQAADELLSIRGVEASFVIYREQGTVNISARSLGEINVQTIIEKLGGGGHFETAGVQIKNKDIEEVSQELTAAIDEVLA